MCAGYGAAGPGQSTGRRLTALSGWWLRKLKSVGCVPTACNDSSWVGQVLVVSTTFLLVLHKPPNTAFQVINKCCHLLLHHKHLTRPDMAR